MNYGVLSEWEQRKNISNQQKKLNRKPNVTSIKPCMYIYEHMSFDTCYEVRRRHSQNIWVTPVDNISHRKWEKPERQRKRNICHGILGHTVFTHLMEEHFPRPRRNPKQTMVKKTSMVLTSKLLWLA